MVLRTALAVLLIAGGLSAQTPTAFLADSNLDQLFTVDISTGAATLIGPTGANGLSTPSGLAYDGSTLYALDLSGGGIHSIDPATGTTTLLSTTGTSGWQDITWDALTSQFYAVNQDDTLVTIDPAGTTTLIGTTTGAGLITAIAFDANGQLWGSDFTAGTIGTIDTTTGIFTTQFTAVTGIQGMDFEPNSGLLYAASTNTDSLYVIDVVVQTTTLVGAHGAGVVFAKGFRFGALSTCGNPVYQVNTRPAYSDLNGVVSNGCAPAITTANANDPLFFQVATDLTPVSWEGFASVSPLLPVGAGGVLLPDGQMINVNLRDPFGLFIFGGTRPSFTGTLPLGGAGTFQTSAPAGPLTLSIQNFFLDPTSPIGLRITQGMQLEVL